MYTHPDSRSERIRQFYKANPDTYLLDSEVAEAVDGAVYNITTFRHQQIRKGHSMSCITVGTGHAFKFTGKINKTVEGSMKCDDPKYAPCHPVIFDTIQSMIDPTAGKRYETAILIKKLNVGYWTDEDLAELAGISTNTASQRRIRLIRDFDLVEHTRGFANKRERIIVPAHMKIPVKERIINWDYEPHPERAAPEQTKINTMLNNVFS